MSVADEISRIKGNIASAYTAASGKGATMPDVQNSANLASCIDTISGGGGSATKFGVSIDNMIGNVDAGGGYIQSYDTFTFDASPIKEISQFKKVTYPDGTQEYVMYTLANRFYGQKTLVGVIDFSNLEYALAGALTSAFEGTSTEEVFLPSPSSRLDCTFDSTFNSCERLHTVNIQTTDCSHITLTGSFANCFALATIKGLDKVTAFGLSTNAFEYCYKLTGVLRFDALEQITNSCQRMFRGDTGITGAYFPMLTVVSGALMGSSSSNGMFAGCTGLLEIHFRADMQATIEALSGYASKFGATKASIIFDL